MYLKMLIWKWVSLFNKETDWKFAVVLQLTVVLMQGKNLEIWKLFRTVFSASYIEGKDSLLHKIFKYLNENS
jgi:hypothetical protein